jgi:hypothetical protein
MADPRMTGPIRTEPRTFIPGNGTSSTDAGLIHVAGSDVSPWPFKKDSTITAETLPSGKVSIMTTNKTLVGTEWLIQTGEEQFWDMAMPRNLDVFTVDEKGNIILWTG